MPKEVTIVAVILAELISLHVVVMLGGFDGICMCAGTAVIPPFYFWGMFKLFREPLTFKEAIKISVVSVVPMLAIGGLISTWIIVYQLSG